MISIPLDGDGWELYRAELRPIGASELPNLAAALAFGAVSVPGNLQTQLGLVEPWLDTPEVTTLNDYEWLYRTTFRSPHGPDESASRAFVEFDGVDYFCDVWVNGFHVGRHEGAFTAFEFDVSSCLRPPGELDDLVVAVSCPWRVDSRSVFLTPSAIPSPAIRDSEYMKGNLLHYWDALPLSGQAVFPFGLSGGVRLVTRAGAVLRHVSVATVGITQGQADLELCCEWWSGADVRQEIALECQIEPETFDGIPVRFQAVVDLEPDGRETRVRFSLTEPRLWWTWDLGDPDLYRITVSTSAGGSQAQSIFGIRTLTRNERTLAYSLNGQRLFLRGVWYPFASIFSAATSAMTYARDAEMLREANVNHLLVFTFIEGEALYEACDRLGILVFQELPFAQHGPMRALSPEYPRHAEFTAWALDEVRSIVRRCRGHASLVLWGAFAETRRDGKWAFGDYEPFAEAIGEIVRALHADALYHPSFCDLGEEHLWSGALGIGEFGDHYDRNPRFVSEFGAIAPPVVETLRETLRPGTIWGRDEGATGRLGLPIDAAEYAYLWAYDYAGLCTSVARMFHHVDPSPSTLERFIDALQWYQAYGLRYCVEAYRRKRFRDVAGCRMWSYRDIAPGIQFTVVDHRQRPKMGYFALRDAYAPLLLSLDERAPLAPQAAGSTYIRDLWAINDSPNDERLDVRIRLYDGAGHVLSSQDLEVGAAGDSCAPVGAASIDVPAESGGYLLRIMAVRADGTEVPARESWLRVVRPAFEPTLKVLVLGQRRYNEPVLEALASRPGIQITVVDERRDPQDSSWSEALASRVDVAWFTGWDNAAHQFRSREWRSLASAVESGMGFIHTGGQGSFHGGDGRGALLDCTPLGDVLPVTLRPHDAAWDLVRPDIRPMPERSALVDLPVETMPFRGFHRVDRKSDASVHWTLAGWPLLVTGRHGVGTTLAFTGSFTHTLQMLSTNEQDDRFWSEASMIMAGGTPDANDMVQPPWAREDIRAYGRFWSALPEIALAFLAFGARREPSVAPVTLSREHRKQLFELLAELPVTRLGCSIKSLEWDPGRKETKGVISVVNEGPVVARLVRGAVLTNGTRQHRFRDGFVDLLPGETCDLRFEAGCQPNAIAGIVVSGQNAEPTHISRTAR